MIPPHPDDRRLATNSAYALAGRLAVIALALILAVGLFRLLGEALYGAWTLLAVIVTSATVLDLGLAGAVEREVAASQVRGDPARAGAVVVAALALVAAMVIVAQSAVILWPAPTGDLADVVWPGVRILPVAFGLMLAALVLGGALTGLQRFGACHAWRVAGLTLGTAATLSLAALGVTRLDALLAAYGGGALVAALASLIALRRVWPAVPLLVRPDRASTFDLLNLGGALQAASLGPLVADYVFRLVVGRRFGAAGIGVYDLASRVSISLRSLVGALMSALVPHAVSLFESSSRAALRALHQRAVEIAAFLIVPGTCALVLFADDMAAVLVRADQDPAALGAAIRVLAVAHAATSLVVPGLLLARSARRPWPEAAGAIGGGVVGLAAAAVVPTSTLAAGVLWAAHAAGLGLAWTYLARSLEFPAILNRRVLGVMLNSTVGTIVALSVADGIAWSAPGLERALAGIAAGGIAFAALAPVLGIVPPEVVEWARRRWPVGDRRR